MNDFDTIQALLNQYNDEHSNMPTIQQLEEMDTLLAGQE
jgi:hypothetical protein